MIAIVHSIYSQSVHAPASHARLMDNEAERYCMLCFVLASTRITINSTTLIKHHLSLGILLHYYYQSNEKSINRYTIIATKGGINLYPPITSPVIGCAVHIRAILYNPIWSIP